MIDLQILFNVAVAVIGGLGGWILKTLTDELKWLKTNDNQIVDKIQKMEVLVAGQYAKREDIDRLSEAIFKRLDTILEKLDSKQDKP